MNKISGTVNISVEDFERLRLIESIMDQGKIIISKSYNSYNSYIEPIVSMTKDEAIKLLIETNDKSTQNLSNINTKLDNAEKENRILNRKLEYLTRQISYIRSFPKCEKLIKVYLDKTESEYSDIVNK